MVQGTDYDLTNSGMLTLPAGSVLVDSFGFNDGGAGDIVCWPNANA